MIEPDQMQVSNYRSRSMLPNALKCSSGRVINLPGPDLSLGNFLDESVHQSYPSPTSSSTPHSHCQRHRPTKKRVSPRRLLGQGVISL